MQVSAPVKSFREVINVTQQLSRFHSVCKVGEVDQETGNERIFYGSPGQLCSLCPVGSLCERETYAQPITLAGYWLDLLDLTEGDASVIERTEPLLADDRMSKRSLDDMKRALGEKDIRRPACAPERILRIFSNDPQEGSGVIPLVITSVAREDQVKQRFVAEEMYTTIGTGVMSFTDSLKLSQSLSIGYPHALRDDRCPNVVGCQPKIACKSGNTCSDAYLGEKLRCEEWNTKPENENMQACNLTMQCKARQAGPRCVNAIPSICNCPNEWETGSFSCSKKCLREKKEELEAVGCNIKTLAEGLSRIPPEYAQYMNGAICRRQTNSTIEVSIGQCECVSAPRCTACTRGSHFRQGGECVPCPEQKELIIIMAILGLIFLCIGMRELDKRKFNLAFISIGWDYFQVLALFADADIKWPAILKTLFRMLSFFNIDIDVVAPECLVPTLKYSDKYFATMLLPVIVAFALFLSWLFNIFWDKCLKQRTVSSSAAKIMGAKLISTFLLGMYFMYLMVTRRALEIFNCNPVDPDDGFTYTQFTSVDCDGGLCRCWDPTHVQLLLVPFSILALLSVTLGFPVILFLLLRAKKNAIKEDQYLRALDIEPLQSTNPIAFFNRLKYHKMYYHFKPGKVYWIVFIIARKGLVSIAGLLFRANPGFQLAFVLLVLFWAYVVQVKNQPFMSSVERKTVILEHLEKVKLGDELHVTLASRINNARKSHDKDRLKKKRKQTGGRSFTGIMQDLTKRTKQRKKMKLNYFWNYNTVERVLLSCLIVVCVCGVMFESDRFQDNHNRPSGSGFGAWVRFQQDFVTYMCIIVIFGSMFFYFAVAYSEIFGKLPIWMRKVLCIKKDKVDIHADVDISNRGSEASMIFSQNPAMLAERDRLAAEEATAGLRGQLEEQEAAMLVERQRAKKAISKAAQTGKRGRGKKKTKNAKKGFGSKIARGMSVHDEVSEIELQAVSKKKKNSISKKKKKKTKKKEEVEKVNPLNLHNRTKSFVPHQDEEGNTYYDSVDNPGEVTWTLPDDAIIIEDTYDELQGNDVAVEGGTELPLPLNCATASSGRWAEKPLNIHKRTQSFRPHQDEEGNTYYDSVDNPGEVTWTLPDDAVIIETEEE